MASCCICNDKISFMSGDIPLSEEYHDLKICRNCYEQKMKIVSKDNLGSVSFDNAVTYFNKFIQDGIMTEDAKEALNSILNIYVDKSEIKKESNVREIEKNNIINALRENMMLTTGYNFDGYRIVKYNDVIFEEAVFGVGIKTSFKAIGDIFADLTGDEYTAMTNRIAEVKAKLRDRVILKAAEIDANALIGIDFESSMAIGNSILVSMTATAVTVEKID